MDQNSKIKMHAEARMHRQ